MTIASASLPRFGSRIKPVDDMTFRKLIYQPVDPNQTYETCLMMCTGGNLNNSSSGDTFHFYPQKSAPLCSADLDKTPLCGNKLREDLEILARKIKDLRALRPKDKISGLITGGWVNQVAAQQAKTAFENNCIRRA